MINKNRFSIKDTKKVLHKVGKRWVVVSAVLLGLAAGGAAVTTANANAANVSSTPTTSDQMPNIHITPNQKADAQNAVATAKAYRAKGVINDALNGIGNYIKSGANSTNAKSAYSNLTSMAHASNLASLADGKTSFGSDNSNASSGTWIGELNSAKNDAETINNGQHPKVDTALNDVQNQLFSENNAPIQYHTTSSLNPIYLGDLGNDPIPNTISDYQRLNSVLGGEAPTINSLSYEASNAQNTINGESVNLPDSLGSISLNGLISSINNVPNIKNFYINTSYNVNINTTLGNILANNSITAYITPNLSLGYTPVNMSLSFNDANVRNAINKAYENARPRIMTSLSALQVPQRIINQKVPAQLPPSKLTSYVEKFESDANSTLNNINNDINRKIRSFESDVFNPINNSKPKSVTVTLNPTANDVANLLDGKLPAGEDTEHSTVSNVATSAIHSVASSVAYAHYSNATTSPANASNEASNAVSYYTQKAADMLRAGNYIVNNGSMSSEYNNIVDQLADLPNDNESTESDALNDMADDANQLAQSVSSNNASGSVKYDDTSANGDAHDKDFIVSNLSTAATHARNNATSMSNAMSTINTASNSVSNDVKSVATYSGNLNKDIALGGKPVSANASSAMSGDYSDVKNDNTIASNAQSSYSDWADTDDAFNVTNANSASTNASNTADNAKSLVNVEFSASVNYMDGSKNVGKGTVFSNLSNPTSILNSYPTMNVTSTNDSGMPTNYSLASSSNIITLNGSAQTIKVVSAANSTNKVADTIIFSGDNNSSESVNGTANTNVTVSAPANYHFTTGSSAVATVNLGDGNKRITLNVASNTSNPTNGGNGTNTNPSTTGNESMNNNTNSSASSSVAPSSNESASAEPNTSTSTSSNATPKKHAAKVNYVKVNKALQLHTNPNFTKKNAYAVVEPGTTFKIEKAVKAHNGALRYEVRYNKKNYFITANKHWVSAYYKATKHSNNNLKNYVHYRYTKVIKALQLHTSAHFTKKNGVKVVEPTTEFHINRIVKDHGAVRYEVRYGHKNYFITANHDYTINAYVQKHNFRKHGYKAVRVIKPLNEYRKLSFAKRSLLRKFYVGSVLPVKKVITISKGEMTRLELTNGRYVTANKDFVKVIK